MFFKMSNNSGVIRLFFYNFVKTSHHQQWPNGVLTTI